MRALASIWILLGLALTGLCYYRLARPNGLPRRVVVWLVVGAMLMVAPTLLLEGALLDALGWTTSVSASGTGKAMLAAVAVLAPIEQAALVLIVWPVYRAQRLHRLRAALTAGLLVGLGFSIADGGWLIATSGSFGMVFRVLVRCAHLTGGAMGWAAAASYDQNHRKHWFPLVWLLAVLVEGFGNHVALGMAPGFCVVAAPTLLVMTGSAVVAFREPKSRQEGALAPEDAQRISDHGWRSRPSRVPRLLGRVSLLPERPTIHQITVAWKHQHRPALLHWIAAGTVICLGSLLVALALSVVTARWLGMDLSRVDDGDTVSTGPLLLMGTFVLVSFAVAGYLVALASAADSVFEPGVGALVAIVLVVALLSTTAPVGVVMALAIAPLAFGLACIGAWFGLQK
jgi:hypothetical protein